jgi:xylan 1,4-beta-xylosidase
MVTAPGITITRLNDTCTEKLSEPEQIWAGTGLRAPEGPHLMKKDGYYYAILAEGGTGYGHRISVARSKSLYGPYEACPNNPIMTQKNPDAKIQRSGHGKLVQTQNGDWWAVYLCSRRNEGNYTTVGRETALDPVTWTEDGWFTINDGKGPSEVQIAPNLPEHKFEVKNFDNFDSDKLDLNWMFLRNPDKFNWSLTERKGYLRIWTNDFDLDSGKAKNTILRREKDLSYEATTKLEFNPTRKGEQAGLTCYYNRKTYIKFCVIENEGRKLQLIENRRKDIKVVSEIKIENGPIYLRLNVKGQTREFSYSYDGENFIKAGIVEDCTFLCDEGDPGDSKRHTGTMVGMYTNNYGSGSRIPADFDFFKYEGKEN